MEAISDMYAKQSQYDQQHIYKYGFIPSLYILFLPDVGYGDDLEGSQWPGKHEEA